MVKREVLVSTGKIDVYSWKEMKEGDKGEPLVFGSLLSFKSLQVEGAFGSSGVLSMEGSNNGKEWFSLTSEIGEVTAPGIYQIRDYAYMVRPAVSGGADVKLNVYLLVG